MPTFRISSLAGVSIQATGNSCISGGGLAGGQVVSYTGVLTLNGRRVLSPRQTRAEWAAAGQAAITEADRTEHGDQAAHWRARGMCTAYALACHILDSYFDKFGPAGLPLADIVAGLRVARAAAFEAAPADLDDNSRRALAVATSTLDQLANELAVTASYTWMEDPQ